MYTSDMRMQYFRSLVSGLSTFLLKANKPYFLCCKATRVPFTQRPEKGYTGTLVSEALARPCGGRAHRSKPSCHLGHMGAHNLQALGERFQSIPVTKQANKVNTWGTGGSSMSPEWLRRLGGWLPSSGKAKLSGKFYFLNDVSVLTGFMRRGWKKGNVKVDKVADEFLKGIKGDL